MTTRFPYDRALAPTIWALAGVGLVELCLVHLLVALLWSRRAALALSVLWAAGVAWLVALVRSFRRMPVELAPGRVTLRAGFLRALVVRPEQVRRLRESFTAAEVKAPATLRLSLLAWPNVMIELGEPLLAGRRRVGAVAHRLDDPAGFARALAAWRAAA